MIPLGIVWAGYTLVWYGYCLIKGEGIGLTDLIKPSGLTKVNAFLNGSSNSPSGPQALPEQKGSIIRPGPVNGNSGPSGPQALPEQKGPVIR